MSCRLSYLFCVCVTLAISISSVSVSVSVSACPKASPSYQPTADTIQINNIPLDIYAPSQNDVVVFHNIDIGREVVIALQTSGATGYRWEWMNKDEPALPSLTYLGCSYNQTEPNGPPGAPGIEYWGFRASRGGTTCIPLSYRQPWMPSNEKRLIINLHVMSKDTNVTPNECEFYNNGYTMLPSVILILSLVFLSCCA